MTESEVDACNVIRSKINAFNTVSKAQVIVIIELFCQLYDLHKDEVCAKLASMKDTTYDIENAQY